MTYCTFIVTKNNSNYVNWQTDILYSSFLEYHSEIEEFKFLALVAKDHGPIIAKYPYKSCKFTSLIKNDDYIVYNRILNLQEYLNKITPSRDKYIVLLDPDMVFTKPFDFFEHHTIDSNVAIGQGYNYMNGSKEIIFFQEHFSNSQNIIDYYKPIGCPLIISEYLLSKIVDRWLQLTIELRTRNIKNSPFYKNWICEMYGLAFALAESQIEVQNMQICGMVPYVNKWNKGNLYFYHYCYDVFLPTSKKILFSKKRYKPWDKLKITSHPDNNPYTVDFIQKMNFYITRLEKSEKILTLDIIPC